MRNITASYGINSACGRFDMAATYRKGWFGLCTGVRMIHNNAVAIAWEGGHMYHEACDEHGRLVTYAGDCPSELKAIIKDFLDRDMARRHAAQPTKI